MTRARTSDENEEEFRAFILRRQWLQGDHDTALIHHAGYLSLKARDGRFWRNLSSEQMHYLIGFMHGWKSRSSALVKLPHSSDS